MSKDPAVLFYSSDFLTGTLLMNYEERGQYITLLCLQHQKGHLTEKELKQIYIIYISKKDVEKLAGAGLIANCTIVEYEGSNYIRGIGIKISEIPVMNIRNTNNLNTKSNLMIKCKILSGDRLIGYGVVDIHGKEYKLSKEKIWQLAREKSIVNAAAQVVNNQKRLVGLGIELSKLPIVYAG
jgi:hypothetical protein